MLCTKCQVDKPTDSFYSNSYSKRGYQSWCKQCAIDNMKNRYKYNPSVNKEIKEKENRNSIIFQNVCLFIKAKYGCKHCGENCPNVLQFHHLDPSIKEDSVSVLCTKKNKMKFFEEINKCAVLCANCHIKLHYGIIENSTLVCCEEKIEDYCYHKKNGVIWYWKPEFVYDKKCNRRDSNSHRLD